MAIILSIIFLLHVQVTTKSSVSLTIWSWFNCDALDHLNFKSSFLWIPVEEILILHQISQLKMGLCKNISLALACLMGLALVHTSYAQNSQQDYLNAHNTTQAQFGVRSMTWNNTIASYAQNYANKWIGDCNLRHSNGSSGENFAKGSG